MRFALSLFVVSVGLPAGATARTPRREDLRARHAMVPPQIDGVLDDELRASAPLPLDQWMSYNPLRGEAEQQRTSVWIGYDNQAIYFALKCYDAEPNRIRSTISRRDNVWNGRLGGREPRLDPRRPDRLPHVREPEGHPDGRAAEHE